MQQGVSLFQCTLMLNESCSPNTLPYSQSLLEIKEPILFTIMSKIHRVKYIKRIHLPYLMTKKKKKITAFRSISKFNVNRNDYTKNVTFNNIPFVNMRCIHKNFIWGLRVLWGVNVR